MSEKSIEFLKRKKLIKQGFSKFIISGDFPSVNLVNLLDDWLKINIVKEHEHKFVFKNSNSYWKYCGRNNREYYHVDNFFCEKCLEEKSIVKRGSWFDSELWNLPDWAKLITNKVNGVDL